MKKLVSILLVICMAISFTTSIGCFANEEDIFNEAQPGFIFNEESEYTTSDTQSGLIKEENSIWEIVKNKAKYGYDFALNKTKYGADFAWNKTKYGTDFAWNKIKEFAETVRKGFSGDPASAMIALTTVVATTIFGMKICKLCRSAEPVKVTEEIENNEEESSSGEGYNEVENLKEF